MSATISLIVPTRGRPRQFQELLASLRDTAHDIESIEVIAVVDANDPGSRPTSLGGLAVKTVVVPPGLTMGALNQAGYEACSGRYLMLLNDDVVVRTPGWDEKILACFAAFPDEFILVHVNDRVFQKSLCTFPMVSRSFCELAGGICPTDYVRYRIDDHIEDVFNLVGLLGSRRTLYLPQVIFEHANHVINGAGVRQYFSDPAVLALDAPTFDRLAPTRKSLALQMHARIVGLPGAKQLSRWRTKLATVTDHLGLRVPERLRVLANDDLVSIRAIRQSDSWWHVLRNRMKNKVRAEGYGGLARAALRRLHRRIKV